MSNAAVALVDGLASERDALVCDDHVTSAAALRTRTLGLARWLVQAQVRPGDRVLLLVGAGPDFAAAFLAVAWIGAVPVLVDPSHGAAVWTGQLQAASATVALVDRRLPWLWRVPGATGWLRRNGRTVPLRPPPTLRILPIPRHAKGHVDAVDRQPDDEALLLFTSGTTSQPTGIVHTHGSVPAFLHNVGCVVADLPHATYLAETPQQIFYALLLQATCHVVQGRGEQRVARTLQILRSGRVEAWFGSPHTWTHWLRAGLPVPETLRTVLLGAAPVSRPFLRRLLQILPQHTTARCVYGLTEVGPVCTVDAVDKAHWTGSGDLVGAPLPTVQVRTTDTLGVEVASPSLAPRALDGRSLGPWLDTGDLGTLEPAGLCLRGRRKDMILRAGINLYPGVLEPVLLDVLEDAALVGVYDHERCDERVVLCHVGALPIDLAERLGPGHPDHCLALEALPRSGRQHKVDKAALRDVSRDRFEIP